MKVIKRLFTNSPYIPAQQLVSQYTQAIRLLSQDQLPSQYQSLLSLTLTKCEKPNEFLRQLLKMFRQLDNHATVLKIITLIHHFAIERQYYREDIQQLEDFDFQITGLPARFEDKWFVQFCKSYITYLMKLPALSDVYVHLEDKEYNTTPNAHLVHLFRITNSLRILFPSITNAVNVVGRYQASKHATMRQLFVILSGQLVKLYSYIKYLCDQIQRHYRVYKPKDLHCFIESLPELELLCDRVEDLLVNKYLKGKKISVKIQFKEERVAQVQYYLNYQCNSEENKQKTNNI